MIRIALLLESLCINVVNKMSDLLIFVSVCILSILLTNSTSAQSQQPKLCIPNAYGVPGLPGAPYWYNWNSNTRPINYTLDDPRWRGSSNISFGRGTSQAEMEFRALQRLEEDNKKYLYLSWKVGDNPAKLENGKVLYLGFKFNDKILAFKFTPYNIISQTANVLEYSDVKVSFYDPNSPSMNFTDIPSTDTRYPPWLSKTKKNVAVWTSKASSCTALSCDTSWAINMRIPVEEVLTNVSLTSQFMVRFQIDQPLSSNNTLVNRYPRNATIVTQNKFDPNYYYEKIFKEKHDEYATVDLNSNNCDGVSLAWNGVGVHVPNKECNALSENSTICVPKIINSKNIVNIFFAKPLYSAESNAVSTISKGKISATFRIANWGSVGDESAGWTDVTSLSITPTPSPTYDGQNKNDIAPYQNNSSSSPDAQTNYGDIELTRVFSYNPVSGKTPSQCMLVKLSSSDNIYFKNDSVYRNMDFVVASKFVRKAEININGLTTPNSIGKFRDVYLYVQTLNMPAFIQLPNQVLSGTNTSGTVSDKNPRLAIGTAQVAKMVASGQYTSDDYDRLLPTYRVLVYYDTGIRDLVDGKTHNILSSQPSFGYYVAHDGEIEGWRHRLEGAEEIAPNFYRLRIPNNGKAIVTTIIEPREVKKGGKIALNIRGGINIPHGNFDAVYNPGFYLAGAVEYSVKENFSLEGLFGYNRFTGGSLCLKGVPGCTQSIRAADLNLYNFSLNGKYYLTKARTRPFINFGGGLYKFDLSSARVGGNVGIGFQQSISPRFAVEGGYNIHNVATPVSATRFSTVQFGIRVRP